MKICKACGTLYNPKNGGCPKCETEPLLEPESPADATDLTMTPEEESRARKKAWIQILIGVPLFIGFIILLIYAMRLMRG